MNVLEKIIIILIEEGIHSLFSKIFVWKKSRHFLKFMKQKQWERAISAGEKLIHLLPEKIEYYQALASCYKKLENDALAINTLQKGLELIISPGKLIKKIENNLNQHSHIKSTFVYFGGSQNMGCFEHILLVNGEVKKYLTKISTIAGFEKEKLFYSFIYKECKAIREITPNLINFMELSREHLSLITMEKIEGTEMILNEKTIKGIIEANKLITSIKYSEIKAFIPKPDFNKKFQLIYDHYPNDPISALHSFVSIHQKSTNQRLFHLVNKRMRNLKYSKDSYQLIKRLKKVIFERQLFNKIDPEVHYTLQHGDLAKYNILIDEKSGKLFIIDWGNMRIGPHWVDIAGLLGQLKQPFHIIKDEYLLDHDSSSGLEPIEKLFFVYTLIVTWFIVLNRNEFDQQHDIYLRPAVEFVESLAVDVIVKEQYKKQEINGSKTGRKKVYKH